jgi:type VI secretion system protein ImpI/type VI secretion system protein
MTLTLTVLRCPDAVPPETRTLRGGEFSIGRGLDNDWVLPDPDRHLSKRHCVLAFRAGNWELADTSTNGSFLNRDAVPVGQGRPRALRDGDRLRLGAYEIEIRIEEDAAFQSSAFGPGAGHPAPPPPHRDPFGADPFKPRMAAPGTNPFDEEPRQRDAEGLFGSGIGRDAVALPPDFDPLAPDFDMPLGAPTQGDHSASVSDAFQPPRPAAGQIPDDWDLSLGPAAPPAQPVAPLPPAASPFGEPPSFTARPVAPLPPVAPPIDPSAAAMPAAGVAAASESLLVAAFLRGAEMEGVDIGDAAAKMEALGGAFRALVSGLRRVLMARAAIKGEFRIEQTMIRARGNNPLKFSTGDDDALSALLGVGRRTDMTPAGAVSDALRDIRLHELATMAAMQSAVRALLARLDPAPLRAAAEGGGIGLPGARKARAWDEFEKLHASVTRALTDDFDSVFGKTFVRAYEEALDAAAKEKEP